MGKILLLLLVGLAAYLILRTYRRSLDAPPRSGRGQAVEDMVRCAHCGVNLPRSEAIFSGGDFYCTPEHRELGPS